MSISYEKTRVSLYFVRHGETDANKNGILVSVKTNSFISKINKTNSFDYNINNPVARTNNQFIIE